MERLTNKYGDLIEEVKKELFNLDIHENEDCILSYSEMPWFAGGQVSLFLVKNHLLNRYKIVKKDWDNIYGCERFSSGVFNLDRLRINTKTSEMSTLQQMKFINLIEDIKVLPATIESEGYILLDGVEYELNIKTKTRQKL